MKFVAVSLIMIGIYAIYEIGIRGASLVSAGPSPGAGAGAPSGGSGRPPVLTSGPAGVPSSSIWLGVVNQLNGFGELVSSLVANADQQGLTLAGGGSLWHDLNYHATAGMPVKVGPTGSGTYTFLRNEYDPRWGNLLYFRAPNGGVFGLPHLENVPALYAGQQIPGGQVIGTVGSGAGLSPLFWSGAHLSVIMDNLAAQWFFGLNSPGVQAA